ncbi:MAG: hypothetical protein ACQUHE_06240 [Bacteroidia bacterium]
MEGIYGKAKMLYAQSSPFGWTAWNETEWILSLNCTTNIVARGVVT